MPALWQSSQRPMYIRTIFIDGFRHAILSHDDPYYARQKRRPHSSASTTQYTKIRKQEARKLSLIITSDKSKIISKRPIETDIERLNLNELEQESEDFLVRATPQPICEIDSSRSKLNSPSSMKTLRSNKTARSECKENTELSDRVLQWLDLAGKVDLLAPENGERLSQPRHSWPEIRRNRDLVKSKTTTDLRGKELDSQTDSAKMQRSIDRRDYQVPSSAETIERYARLSRNKNTPRHETVKNVKAKRDTPVDVLEARQKIIAERSAVERQYAELVSKKLIPDKGKKKQVHIFMPEVPKNISNINSRAESLLSQIS